MFENLEEVFDLVPTPAKQESLPAVVPQPEIIDQSSVEDVADKEDQKLARDTYKKMIEKSDRMLDEIMKIADGTEHPRAFEVAANLVKTIADVASKLDEAASRKTKTQEKSPDQSNSTNVNHNHLYVGSSEDLMKLIRGNKS